MNSIRRVVALHSGNVRPQPFYTPVPMEAEAALVADSSGGTAPPCYLNAVRRSISSSSANAIRCSILSRRCSAISIRLPDLARRRRDTKKDVPTAIAAANSSRIQLIDAGPCASGRGNSGGSMLGAETTGGEPLVRSTKNELDRTTASMAAIPAAYQTARRGPFASVGTGNAGGESLARKSIE